MGQEAPMMEKWDQKDEDHSNNNDDSTNDKTGRDSTENRENKDSHNYEEGDDNLCNWVPCSCHSL